MRHWVWLAMAGMTLGCGDDKGAKRAPDSSNDAPPPACDEMECSNVLWVKVTSDAGWDPGGNSLMLMVDGEPVQCVLDDTPSEVALRRYDATCVPAETQDGRIDVFASQVYACAPSTDGGVSDCGETPAHFDLQVLVQGTPRMLDMTLESAGEIIFSGSYAPQYAPPSGDWGCLRFCLYGRIEASF
ncbi:MAG: hypothetical protein QM778_17200 [Myxococcales bacterium]